MHIDNLVIEVTRRCNLNCIHCLRGDSQAIDLKDEVIDTLLSQIDSIGILTLTGGEPFLVPERIQKIANELEARQIVLGSFYIATNGTCVTLEGIKAISDLYYWADCKEGCNIDFSNDSFHEGELSGSLKEAESINLLSLLSIVGNKGQARGKYLHTYEETPKFKYLKYTDSVGRRDECSSIIYRGNAKNNLDKNDCRVVPFSWEKDEDIDPGTDICISVNGKVGLDCDYEYNYIDNNSVCDLKDLGSYLEKHFITD